MSKVIYAALAEAVKQIHAKHGIERRILVLDGIAICHQPDPEGQMKRWYLSQAKNGDIVSKSKGFPDGGWRIGEFLAEFSPNKLFEIEVEECHIDTGAQEDCHYCALAIAVKDGLNLHGLDVTVSNDIRVRFTQYKIRESLSKWINQFDLFLDDPEVWKPPPITVVFDTAAMTVDIK